MYRSDEGAAEARRVQIEQELEELEPRVDELEYLRWKQKELEVELAVATERKAQFVQARAGVRDARAVVNRTEIWAQRFAIVSTLLAFATITFLVTDSAVSSVTDRPRLSTNVTNGQATPADGMQDHSTARAPTKNATPHMGNAPPALNSDMLNDRRNIQIGIIHGRGSR